MGDHIAEMVERLFGRHTKPAAGPMTATEVLARQEAAEDNLRAEIYRKWLRLKRQRP